MKRALCIVCCISLFVCCEVWAAKRQKTEGTEVLVLGAQGFKQQTTMQLAQLLSATIGQVRDWKVDADSSQDARYAPWLRCKEPKCLHKLRRQRKRKRLLLAVLKTGRRGRHKLSMFWVTRYRWKPRRVWFMRRADEPMPFFAFRAALKLFARSAMWAGNHKRTKPYRIVSYRLRRARDSFFRKTPRTQRVERLSRSLAPFLLSFVASQLEKKRLDATILASRLTMKMFPKHPKLPQLQHKIISFLEKQKEEREAIAARTFFVQSFGPNTPWYRAHKGTQAASKARKDTARLLQDNAQAQVRRCQRYFLWARNTKTWKLRRRWRASGRKACQQAAASAQRFLALRTSEAKRISMAWLRAQSLQRAGLDAQALQAYRRLRAWPSPHPHRCASVKAILPLLQQQRKNLCRRTKHKSLECRDAHNKVAQKQDANDDNSAQMARPPLIQELMQTHRFLLQRCTPPKAKAQRLTHLYALAQLAYAYDHFALTRVYAYVYRQERTWGKRAKTLQSWLEESYHRSGQSEQIALLHRAQKAHPHRPKRVRPLQALRHRLHLLEDAQLHEAAIQQYQLAAQKHPKAKDAPFFLWRAAILLQRQGRHTRARQHLRHISQRYARWRKLDQVLFALAQDAQAQNQPLHALRLYKRLVDESRFLRSKKRLDALYQIARLSEANGHHRDAVHTYLRYAKQNKRSQQATDALFRAAWLTSHKLSEWSDAVRLFDRFIKDHKSDPHELQRIIQAHGEIMEAYERQGQRWRFMREQYRRVLQAFSSRKHLLNAPSAPMQRHVSKAVFRLAMLRYRRKFIKLQIESKDPYAQRRELALKIHLLESIEKTLSLLDELPPSTWQLCGMFYVAKGKEHIAQAIARMPLPKMRKVVWTPKAKKLYQQSLQQMYVLPLRKQASHRYLTLLKTAQTHKLKSQCNDAARKALLQLAPRHARHIPPMRVSVTSHRRKTHNTHKASAPFKPRSRLARACYHGNPKACSRLARRLAKRRSHRARRQAQRYYRIACILEQPQSCYQLARMLERQERDNPQQCKTFYQRACQQGHRQSCARLANLHNPQGDDDLLMRWLYNQRACQLGHTKACIRFAKLLHTHHGLHHSPSSTQKALAHACKHGYSKACNP